MPEHRAPKTLISDGALQVLDGRMEVSGQSRILGIGLDPNAVFNFGCGVVDHETGQLGWLPFHPTRAEFFDTPSC
jgi:hypothetical protein